MSDNSMNFELKLRTDEFDKSIANSSKAVDNFSASNENLAEVLGDVESSLEDNVKVYKDFDKQLKSTKGNTDNLAKAFKEELDRLKDLSKEINTDSNIK